MYLNCSYEKDEKVALRNMAVPLTCAPAAYLLYLCEEPQQSLKSHWRVGRFTACLKTITTCLTHLIYIILKII